MNKKIVAAAIASSLMLLTLSACSSDADVASNNVSKAADNFEVNRRIVVFNGITDKYIAEIIGACSITVDVDESQLEAICRTSPGHYKKFMFGLSDNVSYSVEQGEPVTASTSHYRVTFKPSTILPDFDLR